MTTVELDDSDVISAAWVVVTFTDRVERWGPASIPQARETKAGLDADPPPGYVSSLVEVPSEQTTG